MLGVAAPGLTKHGGTQLDHGAGSQPGAYGPVSPIC